MAKKKRRKSKKNKGNITLIVMLAVIFVIIGIFVFKAIGKDKMPVVDDTTTTTTESEYQQGSSWGDDEPDVSYETEDVSKEETSTESESGTTTQELTTEPLTLPINNEPEDMVDIILAHYTDLMGFSEGALFVKESETEETAGGYTYTLRLNANGSPNELIGDVYVEKGTGRVTDSMGNEPWNIED